MRDPDENDAASERRETPVKFTIHKSDKTGEYWFRIVAANGNIIASSEQYTQKRSALDAVESIKKNSLDAPVVDETA